MTSSGPRVEASRRIRRLLLAPRIVIVTLSIVIGFLVLLFVQLLILRNLHVYGAGDPISFVYGFLLASFLAVVAYVAIIFSGAASHLSGAHAENWTREVFGALGKGWTQFSNVPFSVGWGEESWVVDVDHIVVGPYGVLVVETKYSSSPIDLNAAQLEQRCRDAIVQVQDNAARVRALLFQVRVNVPIRPTVVFWGRQVKAPKAGIRRVEGNIEKIRILHGGGAKDWRPRLLEKVLLTPQEVQLISQKIETYLDKTAPNQ